MRGEDRLKNSNANAIHGSPPHARGRLDVSKGEIDYERITPACAGKTDLLVCFLKRRQDHPRMRGEDNYMASNAHQIAGSPPHARGRRAVGTRAARLERITPACAGKTSANSTRCANWPGSPPHARGRHGKTYGAKKKCRITPACAGKTSVEDAIEGMFEDHPRMRGEDMRKPYTMALRRGSPPHARGRHVTIQHVLLGRRITPACAGKTSL